MEAVIIASNRCACRRDVAALAAKGLKIKTDTEEVSNRGYAASDTKLESVLLGISDVFTDVHSTIPDHRIGGTHLSLLFDDLLVNANALVDVIQQIAEYNGYDRILVLVTGALYCLNRENDDRATRQLYTARQL